MSAFLVVAVFRNANGTLSAPEIWQGAVGETPSILYGYWLENLDNFQKGQEPIGSHVLEICPHGNPSKIIPWNRVVANWEAINGKGSKS